jgi:leucyl/phenylalanyl-tRNA--protein transferase
VARRVETVRRLDPATVLSAYRQGFFPMADSQHGDIAWYSPDPRAIIPLDHFHVSRSLRRAVRRGDLTIRIDTSFATVIRECANREETWISDEIIEANTILHRRGHVHSIEAWRGEWLAGGLYGVTLGGAFFGESMFSRETDDSKVALVFLVEHLKNRGYLLLDTQFINDHVRQFGAREIPRQEYLTLLASAVEAPLKFL